MIDDTLRKRLAALMETASGRGTTEAEAMAAAEMMARIMAEHGIEPEDIEFDEAEAALKTKRPTSRTALIGTIAVCTNTAATLRRDWNPCVIYIGKAPRPEIATYLTVVCDRAIDQAVVGFKTTPEYKRRRTMATRRQAVQDFTVGMVQRLSSRLFEMFEASIDTDAAEKARLVSKQRIKSVPMTLSSGKVRFDGAAWEGFVAGNRTQLAHGVNGGRPVRQIGGAA